MFHYVYILQSQSNPEKCYTGYTSNLTARLRAHNNGKNPSTAKFIPWKIHTAIALTDKGKALAMEKYLKSSSGKAFASKHF